MDKKAQLYIKVDVPNTRRVDQKGVKNMAKKEK